MGRFPACFFPLESGHNIIQTLFQDVVNDFLSLNTFLNICQKFSSHSCSFDIISAQKKHTGVCGIPGAVNGDEQEVVSTHLYFVSSEKKSPPLLGHRHSRGRSFSCVILERRQKS